MNRLFGGNVSKAGNKLVSQAELGPRKARIGATDQISYEIR